MSAMREVVGDPGIELLRQIGSLVNSALSLDEILGEVVGLTVQATRCDACLVYLLDRSTGEMVLRASQLPHPSDVGYLRIRSGEGITGWVAEHKSVVALGSNAAADPRFKKFSGLVEDGYQAFLSVPLTSAGEAVGVINVHHREPHQHTQQEVAMVLFVGDQLGAAISRSLLAEENARLQEVNLQMQQELETRKGVERAKGVLQKRYGLSEEQAYANLRTFSRRLRRPMRDMADAVLLAEEIGTEGSRE